MKHDGWMLSEDELRESSACEFFFLLRKEPQAGVDYTAETVPHTKAPVNTRIARHAKFLCDDRRLSPLDVRPFRARTDSHLLVSCRSVLASLYSRAAVNSFAPKAVNRRLSHAACVRP